MGRVLRREVVAFKCEPRSCDRVAALVPVPAPSTWHDEVAALQQLVAEGWGFVLNAQLRSYCPEHADRVWECNCRTNPRYKHLCTAHSSEAAEHNRCVPASAQRTAARQQKWCGISTRSPQMLKLICPSRKVHSHDRVIHQQQKLRCERSVLAP